MNRAMTNIETQICERLHKLKNYIKGRVGTSEVADDLYGETALKILRKVKREKTNNGHSLDAFMRICARTVISDYFKKERIRKQLLKDEYVNRVRTFKEGPDKEYEVREENNKFMERARKELSSAYRKALILLLFQNMNHYEIADTLGIPRVTISTYMLRMRRRLGDVHLNKARDLTREN